MALLFAKLLDDVAKKNDIKYGSKAMHEFLRQKAMAAVSRNYKPQRLINTRKSRENIIHVIEPGKMICYFYDAKHKATLPYWDKFPVVFPIEKYKDGFLAINLHYLPPQYRAVLMDRLFTLLSDKKYNDETKLKISYEILAAASKFKYFKPCIKRYLFSHIKSHMVQIDAAEWNMVAFLPLARFQKATQAQVWSDSINKIRG